MITHVVLFRFRPDARRHLESARAALASLDGQVPELRSISVGVNVLASDRAYDLGLVAQFDDLDALAAYRAHPAHRAVAATVDDHCTSTISVDYES
ncbi:Stress responsive A/B Barrel Domain [Pseudonocardia thermophila]|uniref:Stress responsive A/B Barrel Domain n=1 Tax=Pseudonocardia thermophila TaxID=1848 RepID=A0A1M6TRU0_PSETH|nr:Dabb family protein [Pseudonocardia thermophila]SHK59548.1 Stress responsive A/B Barrel Domain [Pseudonocardia thermophila]